MVYRVLKFVKKNVSMRRLLVLFLVVAMAFTFFSCGQKEEAKEAEATEEAAQEAEEPAEFIIVNGAEPETLDPHLITGVPEHRIYMSLFEGLLTYDPETGSHYAWFPNMFIKGAQEYNSGEAGPEAVEIEAVDDLTFEMNLVGPLPYVLDALPHYSFAVVPMHAIEEYGKEWTSPENFVGNGPFTLEEWAPQDKLSVVPNETYWDAGAVSLDRVVYLPIDDNNTGYNMYINDEADWMTTIPLDRMDQAKLRDDYHNAPYLGTYYYVIQNEREPFDDSRVRKALAMSFDRTVLVEKVTKQGQIPATSMVPEMAGYPAIDGYGKDVERAQELLAEAGFPEGEGFPEFEILYNTNEAHKKIAEYIQEHRYRV